MAASVGLIIPLVGTGTPEVDALFEDAEATVRAWTGEKA
jgi:hypothetical protein